MGCNESTDIKQRPTSNKEVLQGINLDPVAKNQAPVVKGQQANNGNIKSNGEGEGQGEIKISVPVRKDKENKGTEIVKVVESEKKQNKVAAMKPMEEIKKITQTEYIEYLFKYIKENKKVNVILDEKVYTNLEKDLKQHYWSPSNKGAMIKNIEDLITFALSQTCKDFKNGTKYKSLQKFGKQFSKEVYKVQNQVTMTNYWLLESFEWGRKYTGVFNFSFGDAEIVKIADETKKMCEIQLSSIFYLSNYLWRCCKSMEANHKPLSQILQTLHNKAMYLNEQYSVRGIKQKQKNYFKREEEPDQICNRFKTQKYPDEPIVFVLTEPDKEKQLQDEIMRMVEIAKNSYGYFNQLLYGACIDNQGYGFKSNLKLSSRENRLALNRVKEKLLKKEVDKVAKETYEKKKDQFGKCKKIKERIDIERNYLNQVMGQIAKKMDKVPFTVSDLLRGKCLFSKVAHINEAVLAIKKNIERQQKAGKRVKLTEIDNRLGDDKLTKDLVLKVKIDDLICEFQMSLPFRLAESEINHKMYQLGRSKILSDLSLLEQWNQKAGKEYLTALLKSFNAANPYQKAMDPNKKRQIQKLLEFAKTDKESLLKPDPKIINLEASLTALKLGQAQEIGAQVQAVKKNELVNSLEYFFGVREISSMMGLRQKVGKNQMKAYDERVTEIYTDMQLKAGDYVKPLEHFIKRKQKLKGQETQENAEVLHKIGYIYYKTGKMAESMEILKSSLAIRQKIKGRDSIQYYVTYSLIGLISAQTGKPAQAQQCIKTYLQSQPKIPEKNSLPSAEIYLTLGSLLTSLNRPAEAFDFLSRCLTLYEHYYGKYSIECAHVFRKIGEIYQRLQRIQEALGYYGRCRVAYRWRANGLYEEVLGKIRECEQFRDDRKREEIGVSSDEGDQPKPRVLVMQPPQHKK